MARWDGGRGIGMGLSVIRPRGSVGLVSVGGSRKKALVKGAAHETADVGDPRADRVAVAGGLVAATPAHAGVLGTQVVEATSVSDSAAIKSVTANCPAGGVVYGGGGYVVGATAQ